MGGDRRTHTLTRKPYGGIAITRLLNRTELKKSVDRICASMILQYIGCYDAVGSCGLSSPNKASKDGAHRTPYQFHSNLTFSSGAGFH